MCNFKIMYILTEENVDCSFMQTIIKLPQSRDDLKSAFIDTSVIEKLLLYVDLTDNLLKEFAEHPHIADFILKSKHLDEIYYVKTFPYNEPYGADKVEEYICYGEYHRNLTREYKNLFFRVDQKWDKFNFPKFEQDKITEVFKKNLPLFSGTVCDTIFPAVYLEQNKLNNKSDLLNNHLLDKSLLDSLYLFSKDYWGNAAFLDNNGNLFEYKHKERTLLQSDNDLISWTDNKLKNVFML